MKTGGFDYGNLDRQIADILTCKPLPEMEVKALCEKVTHFWYFRPKRFLLRKPTLSPFVPLLWSVGIFTVSSTISWSFFKSVATFQIQIICLWEIMLTEGITVWKQWLYWLLWKFATKTESPSWEETMNLAKSLKYMASMTSAAENMATRLSGRPWLSSSTIFLWLQSLRTSFSVSTAGSLPLLKPSTTSGLWNECKKFHMKDQCAIFSGPTPMIDQAGAWILEELAIPSAKTLHNNSTIPTIWRWLQELISLWWRVTPQLIIKMFLQFSLPPITATDATTKQLSWMWTRIWSKTTSNTILPPGKATKFRRKESLIISCETNSYFIVISFIIII